MTERKLLSSPWGAISQGWLPQHFHPNMGSPWVRNPLLFLGRLAQGCSPPSTRFLCLLWRPHRGYWVALSLLVATLACP
jgi:hypothetical protein